MIVLAQILVRVQILSIYRSYKYLVALYVVRYKYYTVPVLYVLARVGEI